MPPPVLVGVLGTEQNRPGFALKDDLGLAQPVLLSFPIPPVPAPTDRVGEASSSREIRSEGTAEQGTSCTSKMEPQVGRD